MPVIYPKNVSFFIFDCFMYQVQLFATTTASRRIRHPFIFQYLQFRLNRLNSGFIDSFLVFLFRRCFTMPACGWCKLFILKCRHKSHIILQWAIKSRFFKHRKTDNAHWEECNRKTTLSLWQILCFFFI